MMIHFLEQTDAYVSQLLEEGGNPDQERLVDILNFFFNTGNDHAKFLDLVGSIQRATKVLLAHKVRCDPVGR